jgi:AcrR family transcriptional regulator
VTEHSAAPPPVPPRKRRGAYAKTAARRRDILEAGLDVFATGFRSGSLREVSERVGMTQAGLLHHFANKNELLAEVLALRDERSLALLNLNAEPGIEQIRGYIAVIEHNESNPALVELRCTLSAEATAVDHPAHAYFVGRYRWIIEFISDALAAMGSRGELREGIDPNSGARGLVALTDGLQVQWLLQRNTLSMSDEARRYARTLTPIEL